MFAGLAMACLLSDSFPAFLLLGSVGVNIVGLIFPPLPPGDVGFQLGLANGRLEGQWAGIRWQWEEKARVSPYCSLPCAHPWSISASCSIPSRVPFVPGRLTVALATTWWLASLDSDNITSRLSSGGVGGASSVLVSGSPHHPVWFFQPSKCHCSRLLLLN